MIRSLTLAALLAFAPPTADPLAPFATGLQPGCAAILFEGEKVSYRTTGYADLAARTPITPRTRFAVASMSKQFTALAALKLVEARRLSLDDRADRWLPEMAGALGGATVAELMGQTAGVRDHTLLFILSGVEQLSSIDRAQTLDLMARQQAGNFPAGTRAQYSNGNYLLLGLVVERVSGETLDRYAQRAIFQPLGMTDTAFAPPDAHGYRPDGPGAFAVADDAPATQGSGGLTTTVADLARYHADFRSGGKVWTPAVKALATRPSRLRDGTHAVLPEFGQPYAAGLGLETRDGATWLQHDGGSEGFRAQYLRRLDGASGAAVLCNRTDVDPDAIARSLLSQTSVPEPETAATPPPPPPPGPSSELLASLAGDWRSDELAADYRITVTPEGLRVEIRSPLAPAPVVETWGGLRLLPDGRIGSGPLRLKPVGDRLEVSFGRRVEGLVFHRVGTR